MGRLVHRSHHALASPSLTRNNVRQNIFQTDFEPKLTILHDGRIIARAYLLLCQDTEGFLEQKLQGGNSLVHVGSLLLSTIVLWGYSVTLWDANIINILSH